MRKYCVIVLALTFNFSAPFSVFDRRQGGETSPLWGGHLSAFSSLAEAADFFPIDLAPYFNNDGIAPLDNPIDGNFDFGGSSFSPDLMPKPGKTVVRNIPFIFPEISKGKNNVSCEGQRIEIKPATEYSAVLVLGSSSNGDFEGTAQLQFSDGTGSSLDLGLSDWCREPSYGEMTAFAFPYRTTIDGRQDISCNIWLQSAMIKGKKKLSGIILPMNENMHVFAITLAAGSDTSALPAMKTLSQDPKDFTLHLVGHAHIDMNWLWLWPETVRVCRLTFSDMAKKMAEYPDFKFSQSQAAAYLAIEEKHPDVFEDIKKYVKNGQWEITGGTWVEGDMNMASGEAIVRQILYAKRYFKEKFDKDVEICWEPDTFGHAWTVPQILAKSGIKYYYFCRCGKGIPAFWWESPDGSRVLAFNWDWYNLEVKPDKVRNAASAARKAGLKDWMYVYGVGDHGGGPRKEDIDKAISFNRLDGYPRMKFSTARDFYKTLEKQEGLPAINTELNFVFEGCYTTHADIKKYNRVLENALPQAEMLSAAAALYGRNYPQDAFTDAWRKTCFNQFHDIFDGSAIHGSYAYSKKLFNIAYETAVLELDGSLKTMGSKIKFQEKTGTPVLVFNTLSWQRDDICEIKIPVGSAKEKFRIFEGKNEVPSQFTGIEEDENGKLFLKIVFIARDVPAAGYKTYYALQGSGPQIGGGESLRAGVTSSTIKAENKFYKITIDPLTGCISGIFDKENSYEILPTLESANMLQLLFEKPHDMSAWNIGKISRTEDLSLDCTVTLVEDGPARIRVRVCRVFGSSSFCQDIVLYDGMRRIDFPCRVDWQEQGTKLIDSPMLKVAFPFSLKESSARFEIPFGSITRPANGHEYPSQKWMDVSGITESGIAYGLSLLNDSKYGCDVKEGVMRLTLLRSSYDPDPRPDKGIQEFTYSLFPHKGRWDARTVRAGYELNNPLVCIPVERRTSNVVRQDLPEIHSFLSLEPQNLILTAFKKAEDSDDIIIRFYESEGRETSAEIKFGFQVKEAGETDLMEKEIRGIPLQDGKITLKTGKYEIKTLRLKM